MRTGTALLLCALAAAPTACAPAQSRDPGVVVVAVRSSPNRLDPRLGNDEASMRIAQLVFSPLLDFGDDLRPRPALAERLDTPDQLTYVVHLRHGVRFHDGRELTSRDVVYTFRSVLDPALELTVSGRIQARALDHGARRLHGGVQALRAVRGLPHPAGEHSAGGAGRRRNLVADAPDRYGTVQIRALRRGRSGRARAVSTVLERRTEERRGDRQGRPGRHHARPGAAQRIGRPRRQRSPAGYRPPARTERRLSRDAQPRAGLVVSRVQHARSGPHGSAASPRRWLRHRPPGHRAVPAAGTRQRGVRAAAAPGLGVRAAGVPVLVRPVPCQAAPRRGRLSRSRRRWSSAEAAALVADFNE